MFSYTFNLSEIDVSHFDTSKVTSMTRMFYWTNITELDLSNFNFDKVSSTNMSNMLYLTDNLKTIYVKDEATK